MKAEFRSLDPDGLSLKLFPESAEDADVVSGFVELVAKQSLTDSVRIRHLSQNDSAALFSIRKYGAMPI